MDAPIFVIRCRVSGGVTGTRESLLKANGSIRSFTTRAEAEAVAADLRATMGRGSMASFSYTVEQADPLPCDW
jgi:hypothetical protein